MAVIFRDLSTMQHRGKVQGSLGTISATRSWRLFATNDSLLLISSSAYLAAVRAETRLDSSARVRRQNFSSQGLQDLTNEELQTHVCGQNANLSPGQGFTPIEPSKEGWITALALPFFSFSLSPN
jgi:hypothetical protein